MSIFSSTTDKVTLLKQKSSNAIGVFKRTIADLASVNSEIVKEQEQRQATIDQLQREKEILNVQLVENETFIGKINEFLGITSNS